MARAFWLLLLGASGLAIGGAAHMAWNDWRARRLLLMFRAIAVVLLVEPILESLLQTRRVPVTGLGVRYAAGLVLYCVSVALYIWRVRVRSD